MREPDAQPSPTGPQEAGRLSEADLLSCVRAAVAAPSLHNSQPWRFRIRAGGVDVYADRARQLEVVDPSGRELLISVGAAAFKLRVAIRQYGWVPDCEPGPTRTSRTW
jgi:nitroreductase